MGQSRATYPIDGRQQVPMHRRPVPPVPGPHSWRGVMRWVKKRAALFWHRHQISCALRTGHIVVLLVACLAAGCDSASDEARREYFKALELGKTGQPLEQQLVHMARAVRLVPTSATYLEKRATLLFALNRLAEARVDYDLAVALADRPYLRFERADLLCALGAYTAAHTDLDRAIAAQPENLQFYPRRALAHLALGRVAEARADVDHAIALSRAGSSARYARAAVLLMEGKPAEAVADLDFVIAHVSDVSHGALPRTVRLLAYTALDQREHAAAEFDRQTLAAAAHWPYLGYRYWLVRRGCANAFIATQAGPLVTQAQAVLAASAAILEASKPSQTVTDAAREPARVAPPSPPSHVP